MDFKYTDGSKLRSVDIDAEIYHYGWVRPPDTLKRKRADFEKLYNDGDVAEKNISAFQNYDDLGNLKKFTEAHPKVMDNRIAESSWDFDPRIENQKPDWIRKILIFIQPFTKRIFRTKKNIAPQRH